MTSVLDVAHARGDLVVRGEMARLHHHPAGVRRPRLLQALEAAAGRPFVALVAPAGYGKTTLLREWATLQRRPCVWLTLDHRHDDPLPLLRAVARAMDQASAAAPDGRLVLIVDDVHVLRSAGARETLAGVVRQPPEGMTIALASRAELPLPIARLRAEGLVTELRAPALAMTRAETAALLRTAGGRLEGEALDALIRRTEGWPAAVTLATHELTRHAPELAAARVDGRDRLIADYLHDEVLGELEPADRTFLLETSILDTLTGELCDAVLERPGSGAVLARLHRSGVPLVALDRHGERYRLHRLLADLLRADLRRADPRLEAVLHARASTWYAQADERESAMRHALEARQVDRAGEILWAGVAGAAERGASGMVDHWLGLFTAAQIAARPPLALAAAATQLTFGRGDLAEHWLGEAGAGAGDPAEIAGGAAALRAAFARDGVTRMHADAAEASALLSPSSPGQGLCRLLCGVAEHLAGARDAARAQLEDGARRAAVRAPQIQALCLAQLALIALDEQDPEDAAGLVSRARAQIGRHALDRSPLSAVVLAVSALVRAQRGRAEEASRDASDAAGLLDRFTDAAPWFAAEVEVVLARAALRLSDVHGAQGRLAGAARLIARMEGADVLREWLRGAEADLSAYLRTDAPMRAALTPAELRILRFLPTHLSFREIGERTCLSANTVKTQANTAYRKLDARSRSGAVTRARALGLLDA